MVRAGIAASACKPLRALQAHPAEIRGNAAGCGCADPALHGLRQCASSSVTIRYTAAQAHRAVDDP
jgi:hypothetical protein